MFFRRAFFSLFSAALAAAFLAGCNGNNSDSTSSLSTQSASSSGGAEVKKVTIGYLPNIVMPQPLIGLEEGEFAKNIAGVSFVPKTYPAGPAVLEALRAGVVDIAYTGPYPPIKAYAKDGDVVLLGGTATGGTELLVAKNSAIQNVAALKGKTIGVNQFGSTVDAMVRHALLEANLNPERDVRLIPVPPAQQADALKRGEVDAVAAPAPWPSVVKISGNGRALLDQKQILANGNYLSGVYFTTKKFAQKNPNFVKQFVQANAKLTAQLNADRAKGDARVLSAWQKVSKKTLAPDVAKAAFSTIVFTDKADEKTLQRDAEIAHQVGILKTKADLSGFLYQSR